MTVDMFKHGDLVFMEHRKRPHGGITLLVLGRSSVEGLVLVGVLAGAPLEAPPGAVPQVSLSQLRHSGYNFGLWQRAADDRPKPTEPWIKRE